MSLVAQFELQAKACAKLGSPLYGSLVAEVARDIERGGVCARVLAGYEEAPLVDAVPLRLMGAVHGLVLTGQAPNLAAYYPSATPETELRAANDGAWQAFRAAVDANPEWIRDWLTRPPQTNEVGRAVPLLAGLLAVVDETPLPVRLLELGSSAGLNLRADHFRWYTDDFGWGPEDSPVTLGGAWDGPVPAWLTAAVQRHPHLEIVERRGCDPTPLDPRSAVDALALRSYVWPDQPERAARLNGALTVAQQVPAEVTAVGAADFLAGVELEPGTLTVVWHSVMRQYVPADQWARATAELERLAASSRPDAGFAHIAFEPVARSGSGFPLTVRIGSAPAVVLARAKPHGIPTFAAAD
ncbi:DUF2332 domain-containing protein [Nocardia blacklockiae]|uniref:DUF2332 domain-containing protein n=1 Tax=Nocardia blacklockiae TaxID=480036 RepID=UPI0018952F06|nr:DUF2332 domain-containing protein [Nocardia blacklockiae]MBF6176392.1 DUF2332 domain-containing protein [Nocardia blacklockiae]